MNQPSPWTADERWQARLEADAERLAALLTEEDREVVDGAVAAADGNGGLDFLVVYGSVARGERRAESSRQDPRRACNSAALFEPLAALSA